VPPPLQLLYAQPPNGEPASAKLAAEPFTVGLGGSTRPEVVFGAEGTRFEALTLGAQDLLELVAELVRAANWYPVKVDVRDQTYADPEDAEDIEETVLNFLRAGREDRALGYLTGPAAGVIFWAVGLTSKTMRGTVLISRDGTVQSSLQETDGSAVDLILQALIRILSDE